MHFSPPAYKHPDFSKPAFRNAPEAKLATVTAEGVAPENFHATSIYPEYFRLASGWRLAHVSRMDCAVVLKGEELHVVEFRRLHKGDQVFVGRNDDISEGIYLHVDGFESDMKTTGDAFAFRYSRSRETPMSRDYDMLEALLDYDRDNGHICWVLGPAVVFDYYSRQVMSGLIEAGYVHSVLAGNAVATHDIEGEVFGTALGSDIHTNRPTSKGHYCHLDTINQIKAQGSIEGFLDQRLIRDGIMAACVRHRIPYVLAGSIRDDGPLPEVFGNVYDSQDAMRKITDQATTVVCMATQLHSIATGNMTASFVKVGDLIRPVFFYIVDTTEFAANKLRDRGSLNAISITTNVHDFLSNLSRRLL
jgi:lysine-ketoglutarate reductase/saccharopine dehydrogenase-like protein (TIGR00300 family)